MAEGCWTHNRDQVRLCEVKHVMSLQLCWCEPGCLTLWFHDHRVNGWVSPAGTCRPTGDWCSWPKCRVAQSIFSQSWKSKVHQYINWLLQVQLSAKSRSVFKDEGLPDETKPSKVARAFWQSTCLAVRKVGGTVPGCGQCILIAVVFCTYAWRTSL